MTPAELTRHLKDQAKTLGFQLAGACPAVDTPGLDRFRRWLDRGYAGEMAYLEGRAPAYAHPDSILDGVRSLLLLGMDYHTAAAPDIAPGQGQIAAYASGERDYHDVIHDRLKRLSAACREVVPDARVRGVVDTAPLLEREFAQLAGIGWIGKNTLLLNKRRGSWFFLAALLTDQQLDYDAPQTTDHCGECRACLDACPTNAFPEPFVLDATRCISYLTIELRGPLPMELRGPLPMELRSGVGSWLFGCDVCQDVCPWNRHAEPSAEPAFAALENSLPVDLAELLALDDDAFRLRFRRTPLWRAKRRGVLRNAAIVLGNQTPPAAVPALVAALADCEPLVRGAAAWALGRYDDTRCQQALRERLVIESDPAVRGELQRAMSPSEPA